MTIKRKELKRCDQCEALMINGVYCHETGCPAAWKDTAKYCAWCGVMFYPEYQGQSYCRPECEDNV